MSWPVKPPKMAEHDWYREIERNLVLTVISADDAESACPACGVKRTIFQAQIYAARTVLARCKDCTMALAGAPEGLWVRTEAYLRQKWTRDGKDPALQRRAQLAREGQMRRAGDASGSSHES